MKKKLVIASRLFLVLITVASVLLFIHAFISWIDIIGNNTGLGNGISEWNLFDILLARG